MLNRVSRHMDNFDIVQCGQTSTIHEMAEERDSPSLTTLEGLNGRSFSTVSASATIDLNALRLGFEDRVFLREPLLSFDQSLQETFVPRGLLWYESSQPFLEFLKLEKFKLTSLIDLLSKDQHWFSIHVRTNHYFTQIIKCQEVAAIRDKGVTISHSFRQDFYHHL